MLTIYSLHVFNDFFFINVTSRETKNVREKIKSNKTKGIVVDISPYLNRGATSLFPVFIFFFY